MIKTLDNSKKTWYYFYVFSGEDQQNVDICKTVDFSKWQLNSKRLFCNGFASAKPF